MKIMTRLLFLCLALGFIANTANAQQPFGVPIENGDFNGLNYTEGPVNNGPIGAEWQSATWPGIVWGSVTGANQGLGYEDTYFSVGAKTHLYEDCFNGRWNLEGRLHLDVDDGRFFTNLGLERGFTIEPAHTDVYLSVWYDSDNDYLQEGQRHFHQVGLSGKLKNPWFDIYANGYIPVADREFLVGSSPDEIFFENQLLIRPGFEIALEGFDVTARVPLPDFAMFGASLDLGGYYYSNSTQFVDGFGGFRGQLNLKTMNGLGLEGGITQDGVYDTTWVLRVVWEYGGGAAYDPRGRDLERTQRNDHIVRAAQQAIIATNVKSGAEQRVLHVDNTADPGGNGTFEAPFNNLVSAENASRDNDLIYVRNRNGTVYQDGIQLRQGQLLLGAGIDNIVPFVEDANFRIAARDAASPQIDTTGIGIGLASDVRVGGFNITGATAGIFANNVGAGDPNCDVIIDQVALVNDGAGNPLLNGVQITQTGAGVADETIRFVDTDGGNNSPTIIQNATQAGFLVSGNVTGDITFNGNIIQNNAGQLVAIDGLGNGGTVRFLNGQLIANGTSPGISVVNAQTGANVLFDTVQLGNITPLTSTGITLNDNNNATIQFNSLNMATNGGTGILSSAGGNILILGPTNNITTTNQVAIDISNNSSPNTNINFAAITVNNAGTNNGISLQNNTAGIYNLGELNLNTATGTALLAQNNTGTSRITTAGNSTITTTAGPAVNIGNSSGSFNFANITASAGSGHIAVANLGNNGGQISVFQAGAINLNLTGGGPAVSFALGGTASQYIINGGTIDYAAGSNGGIGVDVTGNAVTTDLVTLQGIAVDFNGKTSDVAGLAAGAGVAGFPVAFNFNDLGGTLVNSVGNSVANTSTTNIVVGGNVVGVQIDQRAFADEGTTFIGAGGDADFNGTITIGGATGGTFTP